MARQELLATSMEPSRGEGVLKNTIESEKKHYTAPLNKAFTNERVDKATYSEQFIDVAIYKEILLLLSNIDPIYKVCITVSIMSIYIALG